MKLLGGQYKKIVAGLISALTIIDPIYVLINLLAFHDQ
jgi:hypothetical protein